ncbi:MAG: hypothetical protein JNJ47_05020 [Alphaproteobacteria bacterium]|nr:hypothetical protein [Alphaproteobacteria bacterium]
MREAFGLIVFLLFVLHGVPLFAESPVKIPNGFQGLKWGSSIEAVKSNYQQYGSLEVITNGDLLGDGLITIESFKFLDLPSMAQFEFQKNKLFSATIVFTQTQIGPMLQSYKDLRRLLNTKYGPGKDEVERKTILGSESSVKQAQIAKLDSREKFSSLDEVAVSSGTMSFTASWDGEETKIGLHAGKFGGSDQPLLVIMYAAIDLFKKAKEAELKNDKKKMDGL